MRLAAAKGTPPPHQMTNRKIRMDSQASKPIVLAPEPAFISDDPVAVLRFVAESVSGGHAAALATLVEIRGGSARALGAIMAIRADCRYCGFLSGGCIEAAVASEALDAIAEGRDRQVLFGDGSPFFDITLPCGGGITVAIHVLRNVDAVQCLLERLRDRVPSGLRYDHKAQTLSIVAPPERNGWQDNAFTTIYRPTMRIVLSGRTIEADMTAKLAEAAGYELTRYYAGQALPDAANIDADTAVVLLHHDIDLELPVLESALSASPFYIGALGSKRTHERRMQRLRECGHSETDIARIKSPIGLFNRARDARSLALSVLADLAASRLARFE